MATKRKAHRKYPSTIRSPLEDPILPLLRTASQQLDATPGGALGWVVRFAAEDPARWLPGDVAGHGHRLLALLRGPIPAAVLRVGDRNIAPLSPEDVAEVHGKLRTLFERLVTEPAGTLTEIPTTGLVMGITRVTAPGVKPAIFARMSASGPLDTLVMQAVARLLLDGSGPGAQLIACPQCRTPFLALGKSKFCSSKCTQRYWDAQRPKKTKEDQ